MWDHLFTTVNDVGVKATYRKGALGRVDMTTVKAEWGVCAAMSAIWLKKMFTNRDILSAPDKSAAGILYSKWANRQDSRGLNAEQFNLGLVGNAGLETESVESLAADRAILSMSTIHGSYYISTGNHAMAAVTGRTGYYFFDPNGGAWKTLVLGDFNGVKGSIEAYSAVGGYNPTWLILKVLNES
ncbi:MAG: hypothetical protein KGL59_06275 [Acidobacteriota bacterium]|nr:hypothetical protein [Acidobacteriota bacterium]